MAMKSVNRFALIVRPAKPFIEWAAKVFDEPLEAVRQEILEGEPGVYLLPESEEVDISEPGILKAYWREIFKEELEGWCTSEEDWPKHRTEALFRNWFDLELSTLVLDAGKKPLVHDE
jgi:hypothetical protein